MRLGAVRVHALEAAQLARRLGHRLLGQSGLLELARGTRRPRRARPSPSPSSVWIARSCSRRKCSRWLRVISSLRLRLDLRLHGGDVELAAQQRVDLAQALRSGRRSRAPPAPRRARSLQVRRDEVGEPAGLVHVRRHREHLGRQVLERQQLLDARAHRAHRAPRSRRTSRARRPSAMRVDARPERGLVARRTTRSRALREALHQHLHAPVRQAQHAHHHRHGADAVAGRRARDPRSRGSRCAASSSSRSPASASSTAAIERSRATNSGSTMYGNTTNSRSGRTGQLLGDLRSRGDDSAMLSRFRRSRAET